MSRHPIDISEKSGVRYLHFGSPWVQGAMRIARPWALELAYTREMMAGLLLREPPWPRHALLIGLGAGSLAKFLWKHRPDTRITVIEIDPRIPLAARQYFQLPEAPSRLDIQVGDGVAYMLRPGPAFDCILVDGYDHQARAGALDTAPFYQACRARLSDEGLLAVNLFGRSRGFVDSVARLETAFDGRVLVFPSCDSGNAIAFAAGVEPVDVPLATLHERADLLKADTGLDLAPTLARLEGGRTFPGGRVRL